MKKSLLLLFFIVSSNIMADVDISKKQRVAFHEAGHVVMSILLNVEFEYVSMETKYKKGFVLENGEKVAIEARYTEGIVWSEEYKYKLNSQVLSGIIDIKEALVAIAGPMAEAIKVEEFDQITLDSAQNDYQYIRVPFRAALSYGRPFEQWSSNSTKMEQDFISSLNKEALPILKKNWIYVENIAYALLEKEILTRNDALRIIKSKEPIFEKSKKIKWED